MLSSQCYVMKAMSKDIKVGRRGPAPIDHIDCVSSLSPEWWQSAPNTDISSDKKGSDASNFALRPTAAFGHGRYSPLLLLTRIYLRCVTDYAYQVPDVTLNCCRFIEAPQRWRLSQPRLQTTKYWRWDSISTSGACTEGNVLSRRQLSDPIMLIAILDSLGIW